MSSSESDSSSSERMKKKKKKNKKKKKRKAKKKKKMKKKTEKLIDPRIAKDVEESIIEMIGPVGPLPPVKEKKNVKPMTKEEWEKKQNVTRRVYDPETGRNRLVKGDGEIVEEIVSKQRHQEINKQATQGDGLYYANKMGIQKY